MLDLLFRISLLPAKFMIWLDNLLIKRTCNMELYVVCKKSKELIPLEAIEIEEWVEKNKGDSVRFKCPFCNTTHVSRVLEKPV